ncbi:hypothetical protein ACFFLS_13395 [Flavobacterium procerum]|uniref:Uncharacterized protein n=1 Tax=Flavobacterium procerum TaxID=1455569 RepID=A0ABV6BRH8_9FLAO
MRNIILLFLFLSLNNIFAQTKKKTTSTVKKENKEYFDIEKYKDWEIDNDHSTKENYKFLKRGSERVEIDFSEDAIKLSLKNINSPYEFVKVFSNSTKRLFGEAIYFYQFPIGIDKDYDENGKLIKEMNNDKLYKFSVQKLIQKFKKEYHVDLEDFKLENYVERFESEELKGKAFYGVGLVSEENKNKTRYYLIDGTTGKLLYKTFYYRREGRSPFYEYQIKLDNREIPDKYLLTFKGKDYTRNEWDAYERAFYKKYKGTKKITDP